MDDLTLLSVKAAALRLRVKAADEVTGVRAGETGLGVPVSSPTDARALSAAERAMLDAPAARAAATYTPRTAGPTLGGKAFKMSGRGKAGLGGLALLAAAGLGGGLTSRLSGGAPPTPAPPPPMPAAHDPLANAGTARDVTQRRMMGRAKSALGSFWSRMGDRYGWKRRQPVPFLGEEVQ